ncbi:hypothetical protein LRS13_08590 [Svornostia abyssi]|uniref:Uncharacterized protein n=1 Tax=Svornostia abyssi TaxID=2898438 RepID=A0ABY5PLR3_9ACTN|nr:hypothetical protein LRS13_08590 [Parviterribacteraceae bacterium J379]
MTLTRIGPVTSPARTRTRVTVPLAGGDSVDDEPRYEYMHDPDPTPTTTPSCAHVGIGASGAVFRSAPNVTADAVDGADQQATAASSRTRKVIARILRPRAWTPA